MPVASRWRSGVGPSLRGTRCLTANRTTTSSSRLGVPTAINPSSMFVPLCGVVWCKVVWCGGVWCSVVGCGVVWCGVVWCGVV